MTEAILRIEEVVAGYGPITVLNSISLDVPAGAVTTLIGPNGAGKSTLLRAIFGLLPLRRGRIRFAGRDISGASPRELLAGGMVYVPQGRNLFPELSVRHNLELGGVTRLSGRELDRRVEAMFERFPLLARRADAQASVLSGGEQKLLEIARGLLLEPRLLLVDEPSIGLSPRVAGEIFALLRRLRDGGTTVLVVEQNARRALAVSDVGVVLEQGRVRLRAPADAILSDPRIGRLFLGGGLGDGATS